MAAEQIDSAALSPDILSAEQVAARYQVPEPTVKRWRWQHKGPRYFYAGRHVRYRLADLLAWEEAEAMKSAS